MKNILIPEQQEGSLLDVRSELKLKDIGEAVVFYQVVKSRLFDINNWDKICGTSATLFQLTDEHGAPVDSFATDCRIRIDIPGPGSSAGDGYDWVRIENVAQNEDMELIEWTGFKVRPCSSPMHPTLGIAHFFSDQASSTFIVGRTESTVWAEIHGRNELPNATNEKLFDGLRNAMVSWTAKIGLSYPQWKLLTDGLVKQEE